ncbi:hypothetical protein [Peribacillus glennii]|uniref:Uncharacterized protein n=1 Tax=Peribacillus glennii TaxID=2303991 RepID=A0A372LFP8_9BACI|nr:hypothetical protein [Peribacillus glennii]RFU65077.1 hypothetical protein D0466_03955 [Peribacillus glennii]
MKKVFSLFTVLTILFALLSPETKAATVNTKKSRVTYTLKDAKGVSYKVYVIGTGEKKARGDINSKYEWAWPYAGIDKGDSIYNADYKIYLQKVGAKTISYTGYQLKDYVYNFTQKMIYEINSKYKGQPDLFGVAFASGSNHDGADLFIVKKGKLTRVKNDVYYNQGIKPKNIGKNKFRVSYYNYLQGKDQSKTFILDPSKGTFK